MTPQGPSDQTMHELLYGTIAPVLEETNPVSLLELASVLAEAAARIPEDDPNFPEAVGFRVEHDLGRLRTLASSFLAADSVEADAVLRIWAAIVSDGGFGEMLTQILDGRDAEAAESRDTASGPGSARDAGAEAGDPVMPAWIEHIDEFPVVRAVKLVESDGEEESVFLEVTAVPESFTVTVDIEVEDGVAYLVDAYGLDTDLDTATSAVQEHTEDGYELVELDLAAARGYLHECVRNTDLLDPPIDAETWPATYFFLQWLLRKMPSSPVTTLSSVEN